ncbi:MAG: KpsF/GutQ family sugar-phosphate isomerase [candidate division Zixibacteria bacterium]
MSSLLNKAREVILIEAEALREMADRLDESFEKAIDLLYNVKGRVIITGIGKSGQVARKIAGTLSSTGTPAIFIHPTEGVHGDAGMILSEDIAIVISKSGDTEELLKLIPIFKRLEVPIIAITGGNGSPIAQQADVALDASVSKEACPLNLAPTSSTTAALVMGDALASVLVELRGFTADDFSFIHPGGALGRKLIKVKDIMHTDKELPLVNEGVGFKEMMVEMTSKRFGIAIVVDDKGKLAGVFTDGDLRRMIEAHDNLFEMKAGEVATKDPKTVGADELAATAVAIMEDHNITGLVIVDDVNNPIGIIHLHDLLKAKVV